jgi:septal ring factor EnvC (AmiA/AmiB activator)
MDVGGGNVEGSGHGSNQGPNEPGPAPRDREEAARRRVEDAERIHTMQLDAQRAATEQAAQALAEEQRLTAAQAEAFERLKRAEAAVNDLTARIAELNRRRNEVQTRIDKRNAVMLRVIPLLVRLSEHPLQTLLSAPMPPEDAIRGLIIVKYFARQAAANAHVLDEDRDALDAATKEAAEAAPRLAEAEAARSREADSLAQELAATRDRRELAEQEAADAARRAAAEAARAATLRSMLQILETQRRLEEARAREDVLRAERDQQIGAAEAARLRQAALARPTGAGTLAANAKPAGQITPPVKGTLVRSWGDPEEGEPAAGQSWRTEPGAPVVAPCGGTVAFAEPFRGYGLLVIIDCGGGYHAVLSGMDHIAVVPGRTIQDGDAIGSMRAETRTAAAAPTPSTQPSVARADSGQTGSALAGPGGVEPGGVGPGGVEPTEVEPPVLYFELRKGGRPVNPGPWLRPAG